MTVNSPDPSSTWHDGAPTRLCPVDPRTGELLVSPLLDENATRLFPKAATARCGPQRRTGEFVPSRGARSTSELTVPWQHQTNETFCQRASSLAVRLWKTVPRRTWAIGLIASLILIGLSAWPAAARSKAPPTDFEPNPPSREEEELPMHAASQPSELPIHAPAPPATPKESKACLAQAVSAVAEGRYTEALTLFEELHRATPEDIGTSTALDILQQVSRIEAQGAL